MPIILLAKDLLAPNIPEEVIKLKNKVKPGFKAFLFLFLSFILLALFFCDKFGLLDKDKGAPIAVLGAPPCLEKTLEPLLDAYYLGIERPFTVNYATPPVLVKQLQNGRAYGVIISGNRKWSRYLEKEGYYRHSQTILGNSLVVIAPKGSALKVNSPKDILTADKIVIADYTHAPMGKYVKKYLENHAIWQFAQEKIVCAMNDVAALSMVASGSVDLGIVAYSDAQISSNVQVIYQLQSKVPKIEFEAILISDCSDELKKFYEYLILSSTLDKFTESGFINLRKKEIK